MIDISIEQIVEMITMGFMYSIESAVMSFYINDDIVLHCVNNNDDYPKCKASELIKYMEDQIENKRKIKDK